MVHGKTFKNIKSDISLESKSIRGKSFGNTHTDFFNYLNLKLFFQKLKIQKKREKFSKIRSNKKIITHVVINHPKIRTFDVLMEIYEFSMINSSKV